MVFLYNKPKIRCFDLIFQMADKNVKNEENAKKAPKRNTRIIYKRCQRCGGKKKEEDLSKFWRDFGQIGDVHGMCIECCDKMARDGNNYWTRQMGQKTKPI